MNMLEKAARAAHRSAKDSTSWVEDTDDMEFVAVSGHVDFLALARAVLAAIREPDAKMVRAADLDAEEWDIARAYRAMIDATLEGESQ